MTAMLSLARPKQWIKNVVVLAGVTFAGKLSDPTFAVRALAAFAVFCVLSSGTYVLNDVVDAEADRRHPEKRDRPVASGRVGKGAALAFCGALLVAGLAVAWNLGPSSARRARGSSPSTSSTPRGSSGT